MDLLADTRPEIDTLRARTDSVYSEVDDPDPLDAPHRAVLTAAQVLGALVVETSTSASATERAFVVRDLALGGAARILVALTHEEERLELMVDDLARGLAVFATLPDAAPRNEGAEPLYDPGAAALAALPDLASASQLLLARPSAAGTARAELYEDLLSVCSALLGLSWRLRAWAAAF